MRRIMRRPETPGENGRMTDTVTMRTQTMALVLRFLIRTDDRLINRVAALVWTGKQKKPAFPKSGGSTLSDHGGED